VTSTIRSHTYWTDWLKQRWPSVLAVASAALILVDDASESTDEGVRNLGELLPFLPLLYLVVAKLQRRRATWPTLIVGTLVIAVLRIVDVIAPSIVFVAVALIVLVWGAIDGQLHRPGGSTTMFRAQALGMIGFGGLALVALAVDTEAGRYLVAAGWLLHGIWDLVHLRLDKVVTRSYAEACGVLDILVALTLVFLL
jgi:uncharacterized membrane protein HdeD (DUF308 family)